MRMCTNDGVPVAACPFDIAALRAATGGNEACTKQLLAMWVTHAPSLLAALNPGAPARAWLAGLEDLRTCAAALCAGEVVRLCLAAKATAGLPGARTCVLRELRAAVDASVAAANDPQLTARPRAPSVPSVLARGRAMLPGGRA